MERTDLYAMAAQLRRFHVNSGERLQQVNTIAAAIDKLASDLQRDEHNAEQSRDEQEHTYRVKRRGDSDE